MPGENPPQSLGNFFEKKKSRLGRGTDVPRAASPRLLFLHLLSCQIFAYVARLNIKKGLKRCKKSALPIPKHLQNS
jgi:hypothetical protein